MSNIQVNKSNMSLYAKLFTLLIILSPIFSQYQSGISGVSLADVLLGIVSFVLLIKCRFKVCLNKTKSLVVFLFLGIFLSSISFLVQGFTQIHLISRLTRFVYYIFILIISAQFFMLDYGLKVYKIVSIIISTYIIIQFLAFNVLGVVLPIKILPMPLYREIDLEYIRQIASLYYFRPSAIFVEPGFVAHFLLPALAFSLYGWNQEERNIKIIALIYISMILTTSAQAILLASFTIVIFLFKGIVNSRKYKTLINFIIVIIFCIILVFPLLKLESIQILLDRFRNTPNAGGSIALRLFRGPAIYAELPIIYKVIGIGHGNIGNFVTDYNIFTKYDVINMSDTALDYVNGVSTILLHYGVIGILIAIVVFSRLIKRIKNHPAIILIAYIYIILNFGEGAFFNITMVFYLSFLYSGVGIDSQITIEN